MKCSEHNRSHEFLCYKCYKLMCSKCTINHSKNHHDHTDQYDHIDDIRQSLSSIFDTDDDIIDHLNIDIKENDNKSDNNNTFIKRKILSIWRSLRLSSKQFGDLQKTETDISQHFEQLHQYLVIEEHKLKKDIINQKDTIINQIDNSIEHLKHLVNIININNKLDNNKQDNNSNNDDDSNEDVEINKSIVTDTAEQYSTTTILQSITSSSTLQSFIDNNNQTLFNQHKNNVHFNIDKLLEQHNNDEDSLLLDIIHKYNNQFNNNNTDINNNYKDNNNDLFNIQTKEYKITARQPDFEQLQSIIDSSIKVAPVNDEIEEVNISHTFDFTNASITSIGENIYIFGGYLNKDNWYQFSMKSKSIEQSGEMKGIDGDVYISNRSIQHQDKAVREILSVIRRLWKQVCSMIYKGSLYSVPMEKDVFEFNLVKKNITIHKIGMKPFSACHDNNGNLYIHSKDNRFIKYNIERSQITNLNPIPGKHGVVYLLYHQASPTSSYIYSFGGATYGNFRYSIESNQSEPFMVGDKTDRVRCGSASITS
ncbi:hypothetical protein PPL_08297 [Heterostelium album PN500]|uniref:B box-type domain-containing protein n=1 Tax=Heterostelium pallidum (strain ATCC 26659 / Pp 5 / PN500) TaxID=670386 RepID=D3BHT3_HETP5|nr:hypothetical protein PPL_08297 [Heterostelium album PN500]EFA78833.1 hypothetical protein PPL_08297 [Heterostelium album PN500]|eukprot:XP_020430957.1 hypothetical protein PPL_08297 [Heterostelium album PN500]